MIRLKLQAPVGSRKDDSASISPSFLRRHSALCKITLTILVLGFGGPACNNGAVLDADTPDSIEDEIPTPTATDVPPSPTLPLPTATSSPTPTIVAAVPGYVGHMCMWGSNNWPVALLETLSDNPDITLGEMMVVWYDTAKSPRIIQKSAAQDIIGMDNNRFYVAAMVLYGDPALHLDFPGLTD